MICHVWKTKIADGSTEKVTNKNCIVRLCGVSTESQVTVIAVLRFTQQDDEAARDTNEHQ